VWGGVCTTAFLALPRADRASVQAPLRVGSTAV
jgi:hypothetical protein